MIVHRMGGDALLEDDLDEFQREYPEVQEVWYTYVDETYEGNGALIARKGDRYMLHDMGHCSCFGPLDRFKSCFGPVADLRQEQAPYGPTDEEWENLLRAAERRAGYRHG